jgi:hypothetical protein
MSITQKPSHISLHWIWFIVLIVLLDQGAKHLVVSSLEANRPMAILPSVELVLSYNKGISFSWFLFADDVQRWPLVSLSILASGLLGWWLSRVPWQADLGNGAYPVPWWSAWQYVGPRPDRFGNRLRSHFLQSLVVRRVQFRRRGHHDGRHRHDSVSIFGDA